MRKRDTELNLYVGRNLGRALVMV